MKNSKSIIILISILLVFIVLGSIALVVVNKEKESQEPNEGTTNISEKNIELIKDVKYIEVAIEDEKSEEAEYKDIIKIEDKQKIENIVKIINTGKEHEFNGAFGLDVLPYAILYLNNGDQITIVAIDDLEMEGEEDGNYIIFTKNEDEENKKIYKVEGKVATEITKIYNEAEKSISNSKKQKK